MAAPEDRDTRFEYPDDPSWIKTLVGPYYSGRINLVYTFRDLVEQMMMNVKVTRRERQMAYERILVELALHEHVAYVQLWPFIIGTLMRQARQSFRKEEGLVDFQVKLAKLLLVYSIDSNLCKNWITHIFDMIVQLFCSFWLSSESTAIELRIVLVEYLGTSENSTDRLGLAPFLLDRVKLEKEDKLRACMMLALDRITYVCPSKVSPDLVEFIFDTWNLEEMCQADGQTSELGLISGAVLTLLSLRHMYLLPEAAKAHSIAILFDDTELIRAWNDRIGEGNSFLTPKTKRVPITDLISSKVASQHAGLKPPEESDSPAAKKWDVPTFPLCDHDPRPFHEMAYKWSYERGRDLVPYLLDQLSSPAAQASPDGVKRVLSRLLDALLPIPLPPGTYLEDLDSEASEALKMLASDSSFDMMWSTVERASRSTPESESQGEEAAVQEDESKITYSTLTSKGLPGTREGLIHFIKTEIPSELSGRKWLPQLHELCSENWNKYNVRDIIGPALIRGLASGSAEQQERWIEKAKKINQSDSSNKSFEILVKWIAHLVQYGSVLNKHKLIKLVDGLALGNVYSNRDWIVTGVEPNGSWLRNCVKGYLDAFLSLMHEYTNQDLLTRLSVISMTPIFTDSWKDLLPQLLAVYNDEANQSMLTRAAALSAMTLLVPAKQNGKEEEDDEQRHARQQVKQILRTFLPRGKGYMQSLKHLSAVSLAQSRLDALTLERAAFLPRELYCLLGSLGFWLPAAGLVSSSASEPVTVPSSGFSFMQLQAVKGMCRLAIRQKRQINAELPEWAHAKRVLVDSLLRPAFYWPPRQLCEQDYAGTEEPEDITPPLYGEYEESDVNTYHRPSLLLDRRHLALQLLVETGLMDEHLREELMRELTGRLERNEPTSREEAIAMARNLLDLVSLSSRYGAYRYRDAFRLPRRLHVTEGLKRCLHAIAWCDMVWSSEEEDMPLRHDLKELGLVKRAQVVAFLRQGAPSTN